MQNTKIIIYTCNMKNTWEVYVQGKVEMNKKPLKKKYAT